VRYVIEKYFLKGIDKNKFENIEMVRGREEKEMELIKTITIPAEQRKRTTLANNLSYDTLEIYDSKVVGNLDGQCKMTWRFKDYTGIDVVIANLNSQFAQIVFLTGVNSKSRTIGIDLGALQNQNAMNDTNRILFCSGMFSFGKTNEFANSVAIDIKKAYEHYHEALEASTPSESAISSTDELRKYKELLDDGIITQEEFDAKKKQLLGL